MTLTADQAVGEDRGTHAADAPARKAAEDFLRTTLAVGPLAVRQIEAEANAAGLSWRTVRRAKEVLGVKASKTGLDGGWVWALPQDGQE